MLNTCTKELLAFLVFVVVSENCIQRNNQVWMPVRERKEHSKTYKNESLCGCEWKLHPKKSGSNAGKR